MLVNLLPWRERAQRERAEMLIRWVGRSFIGLVLLMLLWSVTFWCLAMKPLAAMSLLKENFHVQQGRWQQLSGDYQHSYRLLDHVLPLLMAEQHTVFLLRWLSELPKVLPVDVVLDKLQILDQQVLLQGVALSSKDITALVDKMEIWQGLHDIQLIRTQQMTTQAYRFVLQAQIPKLENESGRL